MVKYADTSWWQNVTPYLQAGGIGAGIGALGGAGVGALMGKGDWKKALKAALIGTVAGAIAGPAVYAGYSRLFPGQAAQTQRVVAAPPAAAAPPAVVTLPAAPGSAQPAQLVASAPVPSGPEGPPKFKSQRVTRLISPGRALEIINENPLAHQIWEAWERPTDSDSLEEILREAGYNYRDAGFSYVVMQTTL